MLTRIVVTFKLSFAYAEKARGLMPSSGVILIDPSLFLSEAVGFQVNPKKIVPLLPEVRTEPLCIYWLEFKWKSNPSFLFFRYFKFAETSALYFLKFVLVRMPS